MTRVKRKNIKQQKHKKILKLTRSYNGLHSKLFSQAKQQLFKSLRSSFVNRKQWKQKTRKQWVKTISQMLKKFDIFFKRTYVTQTLPFWVAVPSSAKDSQNWPVGLRDNIKYFKYKFEVASQTYAANIKENKNQLCINYSDFIFCLKNESIVLNRKMLAHLFIFNQKLMFKFVKSIGKLNKQRKKITHINSYSNLLFNYYWSPLSLINRETKTDLSLSSAPLWHECCVESNKNSNFYFAYSVVTKKWYLIDLHLFNKVLFTYKLEGKTIKWLNQTNSKFNAQCATSKKVEIKYNKLLETYCT